MNRTKLLTLALATLTPIALGSCGGNSNGLKIVHFDQTILGDVSKDLGVSIGTRKEDAALTSALNTALATISQETRNEWMTSAVDNSNVDNPSTVASQTEITTNEKTLYVGLECDYAPFNWTEVAPTEYSYPIHGLQNQYAAGYDVTVAKYLANELGYNLVIEKMSWEALIPWAQAGENRVVIAGMTDTEERRLSIDFTDEYWRSELVLVVKANSKYANATSLSDFAGANIVSQVSTVTDDVITSWVSEYGVNHLNALSTFAVAAIAVQNGAADAMTAELPVATSIVNGSNR